MQWPGIDTIKVTFTYTIATIVIVGGLYFLYQSRHDSGVGKDVIALVAGFVASTLTWVFQTETSTRTARATERALMQTAPPPPPPGGDTHG